jgi:hypothetical protein
MGEMKTAEKSSTSPLRISPEDHFALTRAVRVLEAPSFARVLSAAIGKPIQLLGGALPETAAKGVSRATEAALRRALRIAMWTVPEGPADPKLGFHKAIAGVSGAIGGALGFYGALFELPISTTIMLRAIAAIAQSQGEDLRNPETALACIEVFALGGGSGSPHVQESSYFLVRAALAQSMNEAMRQVAERGVVEEGTSAIVHLLRRVASRFGLVVSQKMAAQTLPVLGAMGGVAVNIAFAAHFQNLAHGHFTIRRLERIYGKAVVRTIYEHIRATEGL